MAKVESFSGIGNVVVSRDVLDILGKKITTIPQGFELQRNVAMIMQARQKMVAGFR